MFLHLACCLEGYVDVFVSQTDASKPTILFNLCLNIFWRNRNNADAEQEDINEL